MRIIPRLLCAPCFLLVLAAPLWADAPRNDPQGDPLPDGALARLGTARFRTAPGSYTARLSPDGKLLAVPGPQLTIRFLDPTDGSEIRSFKVDHDAATMMSFAPAGDVLATTWHDGAIRLWDVATGKQLGKIPTQQSRVESFAFSGDGKTLIVAPEGFREKAVLRLYAVPDGKEVASFETMHTERCGVAVSGDGKMLASWGSIQFKPPNNQEERLKASQTVQIWDVAGKKELRTVVTERGWGVSSAAFSPDGKILAVASGAGPIQFWDPVAGKLLRSFQGRSGNGATLTFSPDGKLLLASGQDGTCQAWEVESGKRLTLAASPGGILCCLAFPAGGKVLACNLDGQALVVWEVASGKTFGPRSGHAVAVGAVGFAPDGKTFWSAGADGMLIEWDAASWKEVRRLPQPPPINGVRPPIPSRASVRLSPDGKFLLTGGDFTNLVSLRETSTGQEVFSSSGQFFTGLPNSIPAAFSSDGALLACAENSFPRGDAARIHVWETASGRDLYTLKGMKGQAGALAISPDGKTLAAATQAGFPPVPGASPGEVLTWEIAADKDPKSFAQYPGPVRELYSLTYSPDGRLLAAADRNGGVMVWDAATGKDRWQAAAAGGYFVAPVVFSPDGRLLAGALASSQGAETTIRLWEVASGKVRRDFKSPQGPVASLAFSPDGAVLATGGTDTTILLWDAAGPKLPGPDLKRELNPEALDALWADLVSDDGAVGGKAVLQLAAAPADAVPFLQKQVRPAEGKTVDAKAIAKMVADLNDDGFDVREKTDRDLAELGKAAGPALRKALEGDPPAELKRRALALLEKLAAPNLSGDPLRLRRAVEALERAGTPEARRLLEALSKGRPDAELTEDAKSSLRRLEKRPAP